MLTTLQTLYKKKGMRRDLQAMLQLDAKWGFPSRKTPCIHVGGTNGKGSVTTKIAACLEAGGLKVGLYTSPHISTFRERIRINGEMIEEDFSVLEEISHEATFFEAMTLLAFIYFAKKRCDVAVIEVGMGGRLDATNIILKPLLSIITTIELDHTRYLGGTLSQIAEEKAGIIKANVPLLVGPKAATFPIFQKRAHQKNAPYFEVKKSFLDFEEENREIASQALDILELKNDKRGLEKTPPCRFEIFEKEIPIILDVAHNPGGFAALFCRIEKKWPGRKVRLVLGLGQDKEIEAILQFLKPKVEFFHLTRSKNPRACDPFTLTEGLERNTSHEDVCEAFREAREKAYQNKEILVVAGTFYIMSDVRKELGIKEPVDDVLLSPY